jgi:hypothetical protein
VNKHNTQEETTEMASSNANDNEQPVWRIVWMMTHNGYTGYGEPCLTYEDAKRKAIAMNVMYGDAMSHWVQHKDDELPEN